jgi:hypothetical protein
MSAQIEAQPITDRDAARMAGQALNALRRTVTRTCGQCGVEITGVSTIRWCSPRCAKRHERAMKRQQRIRRTAFLRAS